MLFLVRSLYNWSSEYKILCEKNMKRLSIVVAFFALPLSSALSAEPVNRLYLTPFIGYQFFDSKTNVDDAKTQGLGVEYRFSQQWAIELSYTSADPDVSFDQTHLDSMLGEPEFPIIEDPLPGNPAQSVGATGSSEFSAFRVDGLHYFTPLSQTLNPYVSAGVGHASIDQGDQTRLNVGAGLRFDFTDRLSLKSEVRQFHGVDDSVWDTQALIGISFAFDRAPVRRNEVRAVSKVAMVEPKPDSVIDSDGDGVPDDQDQCAGTDAARVAEVDSVGCLGEVKTLRTEVVSITFPLDSASIPAEFDSEIDRIAALILENTGTVIEIAGHADASGDSAYNQRLSQRRAESVASALISRNATIADRIKAVGYGETQPIATNETAQGREMNRRVEARVQVLR